MRYINFVALFICLLTFFLNPACAIETGSMIHYSEQDVSTGEVVYLENDYHFKVHDINGNSGDLWIEVFYTGEDPDSFDGFAKEDSPLEYIRTVEDEDGGETEYLVIRITSLGDVENSGSDLSSTIRIEQFDDGNVDEDMYLYFDDSLTLEIETWRSMGSTYSLMVPEVEDDVATLQLLKDGRVLEEEELDEGDYFHYTVDVDGRPETLFMARFDSYFVSSDTEMVFLKEVMLKRDVSVSSGSMDGKLPGHYDGNASIVIMSSDGSKLVKGDVAIIRYGVPEFYSGIELLANGETLDSRTDVDAGIYSTASNELSEGVYEFSLVAISDDEEIVLAAEEITIGISLADSLSSSAKEIAGSAVDSSDNGSSTIPGVSDSTVIIVLLCAVLFLLLAPRRK